jgi:hypothetical protein
MLFDAKSLRCVLLNDVSIFGLEGLDCGCQIRSLEHNGTAKDLNLVSEAGLPHCM